MAEPFPGDVAIDRVHERLVHIGRTQESVARALGCSQKHLSMIFTNQADPSYAFARRLWREVMDEPRCWDDEPGCNCGGYHPAQPVTRTTPTEET